MRQALLSTGLDVIDVGIVHSPGLYFSVVHLGVDGGVMITASHNPGDDNGFKIVQGKSTIHGAAIQRLRAIINSGEYRQPERPGTVREHDILADYVPYVAENIKLGPRRFKVVVDGGNGTGGLSILPILQRLGIETEALYCEPDGRFPNHHPDPTVPKNMEDLAARVRASGAELGIALDGDADRIGAVDGQGRIIWGDQLVMLFAREILSRRPGSTFVSEVKCSQALFDEVERLGGRAIMWKVGHSLIKVKMREEDAVLAGEMSGHMFFADRWFGFDDAVYAGMRLVELLDPLHSHPGAALRHVAGAAQHPRDPHGLPRRPQVRGGAPRGGALPRRSPGGGHRRRARDVPGRLGPGARLQHRPGAGAPLRG